MKRRHPPSHCIQPRSVLLRRGDALFPLIQVFTAADQLTKYWGAKTKQAHQAFVSYKLWIWSKLKYFKITHLWGFLHLFARKGLAATYPCLPHPTPPTVPRTTETDAEELASCQGFHWSDKADLDGQRLGLVSGNRTKRFLSPIRPLIKYCCSNMTKIRESALQRTVTLLEPRVEINK